MKQPGALSREKCKLIKQNSNKIRRFCYGFRKGTCKASWKEFLQGIPARAPAKGSCKGSGKSSSISLSKGSSSLIACHNGKKKQKKTLRRCRSCLRIGSSKAAELFRQSSSQTSSITTRHIKQSKKNDVHTRSGSQEDVPASGSSNRVSARFQQGFTMFLQSSSNSSKFPAKF